MPNPTRPNPAARLAAYAIDWMVFGLWVGAVVATTLLLQDGDPAWPTNPWLAQAAGFAFTTLPFGLYFALCEGLRSGQTLGKRALGLAVRCEAPIEHGGTGEDGPIGLGRAALRTAGKLLPWEVGHGAAYHISMAEEPGAVAIATSAAALLLALTYVVQLFLGEGRPLYDRWARTRVVTLGTRASGSGAR